MSQQFCRKSRCKWCISLLTPSLVLRACRRDSHISCGILIKGLWVSYLNNFSVLCIHAESCWSSGTLCFSLWISAQLISGFPHCDDRAKTNLFFSNSIPDKKNLSQPKSSLFIHVSKSFTSGSLACASCSHSCHRWSAGGGWPAWSVCCLEQGRSLSGGSDGPHRTEWGWPTDPPPLDRNSKWRTDAWYLVLLMGLLSFNRKLMTFFSISSGSRTSLRRNSWGVSLWGSSTVKSVTISVQIRRCCKGLWYGFSCRSDNKNKIK